MYCDVVIARENNTLECYGALLLAIYQQAEILVTPALCELGAEREAKLQDKRVLIFGGYYGDTVVHLAEKVCRTLTVIYNEGDRVIEHPKIYNLVGTLDNGPLTQLLNLYLPTNADTATTRTIIKSLEEFVFGYPSEESFCLQNGLHAVPGDSRIMKLSSVHALETLDDIVEPTWELQKCVNERLLSRTMCLVTPPGF
eukprot:GILJ01020972.1.p1 GENE.GILJ01020972.1~~GILJ01020972.1.p1  ORF type:complete len:198 (-),score=17.12 GILJ01020972.1:233-826(-)